MRNDFEWRSHYEKVNIDSIKEFEKKINFRFPNSYIDIVLKHNGGCISNYCESFQFYSNLTEKYEFYAFGVLLAFNSNEVETMDWMWDNRNSDPDYPFPDKIVPFTIDGCGDKICFDYRSNIKTNEPKIVVWHHEGTGTEGELSFVANSFDEFLDMLHDSRTEEEKLDDEKYRKMWEKED